MAQLRVMEANGFSVREHYAMLLSSKEQGKLSCAPETLEDAPTMSLLYRFQPHFRLCLASSLRPLKGTRWNNTPFYSYKNCRKLKSAQ